MRGWRSAWNRSADHGGTVPPGPRPRERPRTDQEATRDGAADSWRGSVFVAPYLRDTSWHGRALRDLRDGGHVGSLRGVPCECDGCGAGGGGRGLRRTAEGLGAARAVSFHPRLPGRPGAVLQRDGAGGEGGQVEQWDEIKAAASEAVIDGVARSPIITPWAATTAPGTTANAPTVSPRPPWPPKPRSTPRGF